MLFTNTHFLDNQNVDNQNLIDIPNLNLTELDSFEYFKEHGIREIFNEIMPIEDTSTNRFEINFIKHSFEPPKHSIEHCRNHGFTYSAPLFITLQLKIKAKGPAQGEIKEQRIFICNMPMMTPNGTFIINGEERVIVNQLVRSPGVYFTTTQEPISGRNLSHAKLIPFRGSWFEFETSKQNIITVKINQRRKMLVTTLIRCLAIYYEYLGQKENEFKKLFSNVESVRSLFDDINDPIHKFIETTLSKDNAVHSINDALIEFYRRVRAGEPANISNGKELVNDVLFNPRLYSLARVGRHKLNTKLYKDNTQEITNLALHPYDIVNIVRRMIEINIGVENPDDTDHLANRRVRSVGELIQNNIRTGIRRMEQIAKERMITETDAAKATPSKFIANTFIIVAINNFFRSSQLSQYMDQTNPLAELVHKRKLSSIGPGGLSRDRAGFEVRDVHHSYYGRICPNETPEGPNIGLLSSLATYARINKFGFIETPYRKIKTEILNTDPNLEGKTITKDIKNSKGHVILKAGGVPTKRNGRFQQIADLPEQLIQVVPYASNDIVYLSAEDEDKYHIAHSSTSLDFVNQFVHDQIETRHGEQLDKRQNHQNVAYMEFTPLQVISISTALVPFLEHTESTRAMMGANMQRQAVPLIRSEVPIVRTGMEERVAKDSGQVILSNINGVVTEVTSSHIKVFDTENLETHKFELNNFTRSNQGTSINHKPFVNKYDIVQKYDVLANSFSTGGAKGELALGQNLTVAFMSWEGYNFEDAIIISQKLVEDDKFSSIHITKHEIEARETKLGSEEITSDIPNQSEENLKNLDEDGIIYIGAEVKPGDILVGKITPKGETELTAEERLMQTLFGNSAIDVQDSSLRLPHGERGKIIAIQVLSKDNNDDLPQGVNKLIHLWIAHTRKIQVGDKMAGRHGNKGVVSKILPKEDMPYLPDGTIVDIILNPLGIPSRLNLGQLFESNLGWAAYRLGIQPKSPVFDSIPYTSIEDAHAQAWMLEQSGAITPQDSISATPNVSIMVLKKWLTEQGYDYETIFGRNIEKGYPKLVSIKIWLKKLGYDITGMTEQDILDKLNTLDSEIRETSPISSKTILYDGRTGEPFDLPVTVGNLYMLKLEHLVEDKVHARSVGPYSLVTQQPIGGKARFGGQRIGEMEVWALEAYSAAYNLQEMLTIKSDDVDGRNKVYQAIAKGEHIIEPGVPESFHVLIKELQSLGLSIELINSESPEIYNSDMIENSELYYEEYDNLPPLEPITGTYQINRPL